MVSKFLKLKCARCGGFQITFGKSTSWVKCKTCNRLLMKPGGGKAKARTQIRKVIWKY